MPEFLYFDVAKSDRIFLCHFQFLASKIRVEMRRSCWCSVPDAPQILLTFRKQLSLITVCAQNFVEVQEHFPIHRPAELLDRQRHHSKSDYP